MFALLQGAITIDHRIDAIARVVKTLKGKKDLIRHSFHTVRLTGNVMDCVGNWLPEQFAVGKQYRDERLPKVSKVFLSSVFSVDQIVLPWGTAIVLPLSACATLPPALRVSFQTWVADTANDEQRKRVENAGVAYQMERTQKTDMELPVRLWGPTMENAAWNSAEILSKKGKGRVYIGEGRCLYGTSAAQEAEDSEKKAEQVEKDKIEREKKKTSRQLHEGPLLSLLISLGFVEEGKLPTKKQLENFASMNPHLEWKTKLSPSQKREEQVKIILDLLATTKSDTTFKGVQ
jgi:hypothetical protein